MMILFQHRCSTSLKINYRKCKKMSLSLDFQSLFDSTSQARIPGEAHVGRDHNNNNQDNIYSAVIITDVCWT